MWDRVAQLLLLLLRCGPRHHWEPKHLVPFGVQDRAFGPYLAAIHRTLISVMQDLSYMLPERYEREWNKTLAKAKLVTSTEEVRGARGDVKLLYSSQRDYERLTGQLKMLREWKDGIPRGSYHMTVPIVYHRARVFIGGSRAPSRHSLSILLFTFLFVSTRAPSPRNGSEAHLDV
jgi:GNT-I family